MVTLHVEQKRATQKNKIKIMQVPGSVPHINKDPNVTGQGSLGIQITLYNALQ